MECFSSNSGDTFVPHNEVEVQDGHHNPDIHPAPAVDFVESIPQQCPRTPIDAQIQQAHYASGSVASQSGYEKSLSIARPSNLGRLMYGVDPSWPNVRSTAIQPSISPLSNEYGNSFLHDPPDSNEFLQPSWLTSYSTINWLPPGFSEDLPGERDLAFCIPHVSTISPASAGLEPRLTTASGLPVTAPHGQHSQLQSQSPDVLRSEAGIPTPQRQQRPTSAARDIRSFSKRRHRSSPSHQPEPLGVQERNIESPSFAFPLTNHSSNSNSPDKAQHVDSMGAPVYHQIKRCFEETCQTPSIVFSPLESQSFPDMAALDAFVQLYLRHFQPTLPMHHWVTMNLGVTHWLLVLAKAAIGSLYSKTHYKSAMLELLRRCVYLQVCP